MGNAYRGKTSALLAGGEVEVEVDGRRRAEVEVFEAGDGEAEVDEGIVGGIEAREDRIVVVNPAHCVVVDIKEGCA